MSDPASPVYEFGPFRYDTGQRLLFRGGALVPLVPKAVDTLEVLLERRGRVVDKADLMRLIWPGITVEDVGLARNISILRKALEEDTGEKYIETIPKRGYRFMADVSEIGAAEEPVREAVARATAPIRSRFWRRAILVAALTAAISGLIYWQFYTPSEFLRAAGGASIAVVPFQCLPEGSDCVTFAQALDELLVAGLSKLDSVQVVSLSTVKRHQRAGNSMGLMGRLLGLDALVEGSVHRVEADKFTITANLVDVRTGRLIWAESYQLAGADPGQIQAQAAEQIRASVGGHLAIHRQLPK